jgi:hypothetical protein
MVTCEDRKERVKCRNSWTPSGCGPTLASMAHPIRAALARDIEARPGRARDAWRASLSGRAGDVLDAFADSMAAAGYPGASRVAFRGYGGGRGVLGRRFAKPLAYWLPPLGVGLLPQFLVEKKALALHDGSYDRPHLYLDRERDALLAGEDDYLYAPSGLFARLDRYLTTHGVVWLGDAPHPGRPSGKGSEKAVRPGAAVPAPGRKAA